MLAEFFEHHFAKSGHEDLLVTRQSPDHIDIVHLHAREASAAERLRSSRLIGVVHSGGKPARELVRSTR
jgi:hypothetical protein